MTRQCLKYISFNNHPKCKWTECTNQKTQNNRMDKEGVAHIHNGILRSHKKKTDPTIGNNMDGARGYYAQ